MPLRVGRLVCNSSHTQLPRVQLTSIWASISLSEKDQLGTQHPSGECQGRDHAALHCEVVQRRRSQLRTAGTAVTSPIKSRVSTTGAFPCPSITVVVTPSEQQLRRTCLRSF
jgi:hypothetical protein